MAERELLLSPGLDIKPHMFLEDYEGNIVENVSDRFISEGSYIQRDSTAEIDGTALFNFVDVEDFDFGRHLLVPVLEFVDTDGNEVSRSYRMGKWVMQPPDIPLDRNELISINCLDNVSLLATNIEAEFSISPGTNVLSAIISLLRRHGIAGLDGVVGEDGLPLDIGFELATYGNWNVEDNMTYLKIINQLLEVSAHVGIYANRDGKLASHPWTPLRQNEIQWDFDYNTGSGIVPPTKRLGQREQVPNVWIGTAEALDQPEDDERIKLELREGTRSPFAVEAQGGRRNVKVLKLKVGSIEQLERALIQLQEEDLTRSEQVEIHCSPLPNLYQSPTCRVNIAELDLINRLGICRGWTLNFDPAVNPSSYLIDLAPAGYQDV